MLAGINETLVMVRWRQRDAVRELRGRIVHFHFLFRAAHLYSFWVAPTRDGHSAGHFGSGGGPSIIEGIDQSRHRRRQK